LLHRHRRHCHPLTLCGCSTPLGVTDFSTPRGGLAAGLGGGAQRLSASLTSPHWLTPTVLAIARTCSTPLGVTDFSTPRSPIDTVATPCAQRLSASLTSPRVVPSNLGVLDGSAQRLSASLTSPHSA